MKDVLEAVDKCGFNSYKQEIDEFALQLEQESFLHKNNSKRKGPEDKISKIEEEEIGKKVFKVDSPIQKHSAVNENISFEKNNPETNENQNMEIDNK